MNDQKNIIVSHSNSLTEARYSLTVGEQRLVLFVASMVHSNDKNFKEYKIKIVDMVRILGLKNKNIHEQIQKHVKQILTRVLQIERYNGKGYLFSNWFSSAEYIPNEGSLCFSFDPKLKPYMLDVKEKFTQYKLVTVAQFQGFYTIRIYCLLVQYKKIGFREFDYEEFRNILGITESQYKTFKSFRQWVINRAKKEFEKKDKISKSFKSDISFKLETFRTGRKITRLRFIIIKQQYQESLPLEFSESEEEKEIIEVLKNYGISERAAHRFLKEKGEEALLDCVVLYEKRLLENKVKDKGGAYLVKLINEGAKPQTAFQQKKEEEEREKARKEKEKIASEEQQEQIKKLKEECARVAREEFIQSMTEEEQAQLLEEIKEEYKDKPIIYRLVKSLNSPVIAAQINAKIPNLEERKTVFAKERIEFVTT